MNARQGWEPLCAFLGKEVPQDPYPFVNDSGSYFSGQEEYVWLVYRSFFKKVAISSVPVVLGLIAWRFKS